MSQEQQEQQQPINGSLTRQQLAERWNVCCATLRNRQRAGEDPRPFRIGRQYRYRIEDVLSHERGEERRSS